MPIYGDYTNYSGVYGGVKLVHPEIGTWVVAKVGPYADDVFKVVSVRGHAFHHFYRVYVASPEVEGLWYWPWEIEEWPELNELSGSEAT